MAYTKLNLEVDMNYKGDKAGKTAGRLRAQKLYPILEECEVCGKEAVERHHNSGDTLMN